MYTSYTKRLLAFCVLAIIFTAAINALTDPYGMYRVLDLAGFNHVKPAAGTRGQMIKPYAVETIKPRTLILGNSRAEAGLNPESPIWPSSAQPVYNMALPATEIDVAKKELQHALQFSSIETVVLGLDFIDFPVFIRSNNSTGVSEPSELDLRLGATDKNRRNKSDQWQKTKDTVASLTSLTALSDSILTIIAQRLPEQVNLTSLGFNPMREYVRFARNDGYPVMFRQMSITYLSNYLRGPRQLFLQNQHSSPAFEHLKEIIQICRAHNIRLLLFIHPYHAHILESYRLAGLWPMFEEWKRELVNITDVDQNGKITLWDFSGYNEVTTERIPTQKGILMRGYWELGHYNSSIGDQMLSAMLLSSSQQSGHAFGTVLNHRNIEASLKATQDAREAYASERKQELANLATLAEKIRRDFRQKQGLQ